MHDPISQQLPEELIILPTQQTQQSQQKRIILKTLSRINSLSNHLSNATYNFQSAP